MEFPDISSHGLLQNAGNNHGWRHVENLDVFYRSMYRLYASKGMEAIALSEACAVISLGFTIAFSVYLVAFLDWSALMDCTDEPSCAEVNDSLSINPFHRSPSLFSLILAIYFILSTGLWVFRCFTAYQTVSDALEMEEFYRVQLGVRGRDLAGGMQWHQVVERFIALHEAGTCRVAVKDKLSVQDIVLRIMRKDNYLIALINQNLLDLYAPWWLEPFFSDSLYLTKSMEWSLSFCITEHMFTEHFELSEQFAGDPAGLKYRLQVVGLAHFLLLPFMLLFMTIHFFLQNAQQFHSNRAYLGPRQWSPMALWTFREFNELPHFFEERMGRAYTPALQYLDTFHNPYITIVARCLSYICGALVAALLLVSLLSEGALLYVHVLDHNLLWHLGVFSAAFAAARALVPDENKVPESREELLKRTSAHTHHYPLKWAEEADSLAVRDEVAELLQFKIQLFVMEVLSVLLTPAILCFSLPSCAPTLLAFIKKHTTYVDGVGAVCDYSVFNFDEHGDEMFGSQHSTSADKPTDGKLEKSFLNFQQSYPNLAPSASAQPFLRRFDAFKGIKRMERDQSIGALLGRSGLGRSLFDHPVGGQSVLDDSQPQTIHTASSDSNDPSDPLSGDICAKAKGTYCTPPLPPPIGSPSDRRYMHKGYSSLPRVPEHDDYNEDAFPPRPMHTVHSSGSMQASHSNYSSSAAYPPPFSRQTSPFRDSFLMRQSQVQQPQEAVDPMLPSVLLSVFRQQRIEYENDFYWLAKFQHEKVSNAAGLESSLLAFANAGGQGGRSPGRPPRTAEGVTFKLDNPGARIQSPNLDSLDGNESPVVEKGMGSGQGDVEMASL